MGFVRFEQGNYIEAFFHAFRGIESLMGELIIHKYNSHIEIDSNKTPYLKSSICNDNQYSEFDEYKHLFDERRDKKIGLYGSLLGDLVKIALPRITIYSNREWEEFITTTYKWRNTIYHRLIELSRNDLFKAWNVDDPQQWKDKILHLLNCLSGKNYPSLEKASLMAEYRNKIRESIEKYNP